jgi:hypothetical protein
MPREIVAANQPEQRRRAKREWRSPGLAREKEPGSPRQTRKQTPQISVDEMMQEQVRENQVARFALLFDPVEHVDPHRSHIPAKRTERRCGSLVEQPLLVDEDDPCRLPSGAEPFGEPQEKSPVAGAELDDDCGGRCSNALERMPAMTPACPIQALTVRRSARE